MLLQNNILLSNLQCVSKYFDDISLNMGKKKELHVDYFV